METCKVGTLALSTSRATWSAYAGAGASCNEKWMPHGDEPFAVFFSSEADTTLTGCTAYQSLAGLLCPIAKLTGLSGDPPANSAEERSNLPIRHTMLPCSPCPAFAGRHRQAAAERASAEIDLAFVLTE